MAKKKRVSKALKNTRPTAEVATAPVIVPPQRTVSPVEQVAPQIKLSPKTESEKPVSVEPTFYQQSQSAKFWVYGTAAVVISAIAMRLLWLTLKPYHHDEGVNGFFLTVLFREGVYKYDPANYHGPSLYYFSLISAYLFGLNDFALRFVTALFGVLTVLLVFSLKKYLGTVGTITAAALAAFSPGLVFFSRYFIHEMLLIYFCFAAAVAVLKFMEGERPGKAVIGAMGLTIFVCQLPIALYAANQIGGGEQVAVYVLRFVFVATSVANAYLAIRRLLEWDAGRPMYLLLASAALAMTFTTKETSFITLGTMLIAIGCIWLWVKFIAPQLKIRAQTSLQEPVDLSFARLSAQARQTKNIPVLVFLCAIVFLYVNVVFFSSFFNNEKGVADAFEAYNVWSKTGAQDQTTNGRWAYLTWLLMIEAPILLLGAVGALIAFYKGKHRWAMFAALWAFGLFAAYTIIPYKTPWLAINFVLPLTIIAGYAVNELINAKEQLQRLVGFIIAILVGCIVTYQSIELNFWRYDDEAIPYVYVHSKRSMTAMLNQIEQFSERAGTNKQAVIVVTATEHWPLPWSLHDYKQVGFHGTVIKEPRADLVIGSTQQSAEIEENYGATHRLIDTYTLRSGIDLVLYARRDIPGS